MIKMWFLIHTIKTLKKQRDNPIKILTISLRIINKYN